MSRTLIDVDDEALAAAQAELGTTTKVATVNAALREVAERGVRARRIAEAGVYLHGDPQGVGDDPQAFMEEIRPWKKARRLEREAAEKAPAEHGGRA